MSTDASVPGGGIRCPWGGHEGAQRPGSLAGGGHESPWVLTLGILGHLGPWGWGGMGVPGCLSGEPWGSPDAWVPWGRHGVSQTPGGWGGHGGPWALILGVLGCLGPWGETWGSPDA